MSVTPSEKAASPINGTASVAEMLVAIMANISVIAEDTMFFDPYIMLGISVGDGPGALWPLAKAKLYLLTSDALDGRKAERIGLVGRAVPRARLMNVAKDYTSQLATSPDVALRLTSPHIS